MNYFTWSKEENDWVFLGDQYNEEFNNWQGPIDNGQIRSHNLKDNRKTDDTFSKSSGSVKFNRIPIEGNTEIPIKSYKDQCRQHMIRNGIWDVFFLPDPLNKEKKRDLLLHQSIFSLEYVKSHVQSLQKGSKADQSIVQNLTWSGIYLRSTFYSALLYKILKLVLLTATGPEVYVSTMNTVLSNYYDSLVDTLNHMKSLKLQDHPGGNVPNCCDTILVDVERLESAGAFKPKHLGYIIFISENTSDSGFHIWGTHKYKEFMKLVKKPFVYYEDVMQNDVIIIYSFLVQKAL